MGDLSLEVEVGSRDVETAIEQIIEMKRLRYHETGARDSLDTQSYSDLIRKISNCIYVDDAPKIHVSRIRLSGVLIAGHVGFVYRDRFYYLVPWSDQSKFGKNSAGNILRLMLVRYCVENSINFFDLTIGEESYKTKWSNVDFGIIRMFRRYSFKGSCVEILFRLFCYLRENHILRSNVMRLVKFIRRRRTLALS